MAVVTPLTSFDVTGAIYAATLLRAAVHTLYTAASPTNATGSNTAIPCHDTTDEERDLLYNLV